MNSLPSYLGGHFNKTHVDKGTLEFFIKHYNIKTFLDIGCGPGGQIDSALSLGLRATGIDGDYTLKRNFDCIIHDYTQGPWNEMGEQKFDLGWSVEFVEHVQEQYLDNFLKTFQKCKYLVITHAPPNKGGHHHVNCQDTQYWINALTKAKMSYDLSLTNLVKQHSTMKREFIKNNGLIFVNQQSF